MHDNPRLEAARNTLIALSAEYGQIMRSHIPGDRKELLEDLLRRVQEAKREYGLKIDERLQP